MPRRSRQRADTFLADLGKAFARAAHVRGPSALIAGYLRPWLLDLSGARAANR